MITEKEFQVIMETVLKNFLFFLKQTGKGKSVLISHEGMYMNSNMQEIRKELIAKGILEDETNR